MTYLCINKLSVIGSDYGLLPCWYQAIIWPNAGIFLICRLQKWQPSCLSLKVLTLTSHVPCPPIWQRFRLRIRSCQQFLKDHPHDLILHLWVDGLQVPGPFLSWSGWKFTRPGFTFHFLLRWRQVPSQIIICCSISIQMSSDIFFTRMGAYMNWVLHGFLIFATTRYERGPFHINFFLQRNVVSPWGSNHTTLKIEHKDGLVQHYSIFDVIPMEIQQFSTKYVCSNVPKIALQDPIPLRNNESQLINIDFFLTQLRHKTQPNKKCIHIPQFCRILMLRNYRKCKCIFIISQKNSWCQWLKPILKQLPSGAPFTNMDWL